jgi:hypothetical protein
MAGTAQGILTISNATGNIVFNVSQTTPAVGSLVGNYMAGLIEQQLTPNYGSYWAFATIFVILGLVLIARGDKKPRDPREAEPLFPESFYPKEIE